MSLNFCIIYFFLRLSLKIKLSSPSLLNCENICNQKKILPGRIDEAECAAKIGSGPMEE